MDTKRTPSAPAAATLTAFRLLRKLDIDWSWEDLEASELAQRELTHQSTSTQGSRVTAERLKTRHARAARRLLRSEGAKPLPPRKMPARPQVARRLLSLSLRGAC